MADILIKGMELPKKCHSLMVAIFSDGSVDYKDRDEAETHRTTAIELPSHGRLLEELIADYQQTHKCDIDTATYYTMAFLVDAVASGMSSLEGMHKRIFVEANNGSDN